MKRILTIAAIVVNLGVVLYLFNQSVAKKEETLSNGKLVLFDLRPVDPRSLMQGDYMSLRYRALTEYRRFRWDEKELEEEPIPKRGLCYLCLGEDEIVDSVSLELSYACSLKAKYSFDDYEMQIGADSYFFEEGQAERFDTARYGGLMIDEQGECILVGLYSKNKEKL